MSLKQLTTDIFNNQGSPTQAKFFHLITQAGSCFSCLSLCKPLLFVSSWCCHRSASPLDSQVRVEQMKHTDAIPITSSIQRVGPSKVANVPQSFYCKIACKYTKMATAESWHSGDTKGHKSLMPLFQVGVPLPARRDQGFGQR